MFKKVTIEEGIANLANGKPGDTFYIVLDKEYVFHGNTVYKKRDAQAIKNLHLSTLPLPVKGGTVVLQKGDLIVYHYSNKADGFFKEWSDYFIERLHQKNIPALIGHEWTQEHHDVLIQKKNGYFFKVGTHSEGQQKDFYFSCCGLVSAVNKKHIKLISGMSEIKEPAGLNAWNISSEEMETWILDFAKIKGWI